MQRLGRHATLLTSSSEKGPGCLKSGGGFGETWGLALLLLVELAWHARAGLSGALCFAAQGQALTCYISRTQVLSDMAPNFSGDLDHDHTEIQALNSMVLVICSECLSYGGSLVMKTLQGRMENQLFNKCKAQFK